MNIYMLKFLTCFCRLAFSTLAICASVWMHSTEEENAPGYYGKYPLDAIAGFWMAASLYFIASIVMEMKILSAKMPTKVGGYVLHLHGAIFLFIASIWFFAVPRMRVNNDTIPPKNLIAGFILASGLISFVGQIIIVIQLKQSVIDSPRLYLIATFLGVLASFLYFLGGIFFLEEVAINDILGYQPETNDFYEALVGYFEHIDNIIDRIAECMISGSVFFGLNAIVMGIAFSKDADDDDDDNDNVDDDGIMKEEGGNGGAGPPHAAAFPRGDDFVDNGIC